MKYRKIFVEGVTVLLLPTKGSAIQLFGLRERCIPVGLGYRSAGNGWGVVDLLPWEEVPEALRATSESGPT